MAKQVDPTLVLDLALDGVAGATALHVCSAEPADRATALAASLGSVALTVGDFAKANGDVSGRKVTVAAKSVPMTTAGTVSWIAGIDGSALVFKTPLAANVAGNSGDTINLAAFKFEIEQPS